MKVHHDSELDIVQCIKFNFCEKNNALKELSDESNIITRFDTETVGEIILIMAKKTPTLQFLTRPAEPPNSYGYMH